MGDIIYTELKEASRTIAAEKGRKKSAGNKRLLETTFQIMDIAIIVRREGLPVLENFTHRIEDKSIAAMIMYAIDGTTPEILEDVCWSKYFASELKSYDALIYMLWMKALLSMQEGENPVIVSERLKAMLPEDVAAEYEKKLDERGILRQINDIKADMETVKKLCEEELTPEPGTEGYMLVNVAEHIFDGVLTDAGMKTLAEGLDPDNAAIAFKGFNGKTRKAFFDNMPEENAVLIAGNMERMGPVLRKHIFEEAYVIFSETLKLMEEGRIEGDPSILRVIGLKT